MAHILITGGNGYIATSVRNVLKDTHMITSISRADFDLADSHQTRAWFGDKFFDVVIHTAINGGSRLRTDATEVLDTNLKMYYNLLDNRGNFGRVINIGSGAELLSVNTSYGLSKHVIRTSLLEKENFYNIRVYGIFDENELDTRFIKANILKYINGVDIEILQDKMMDFFYMKDFTKLVQYYIDTNNPSKEFECCYSESFYLSQIANKINNLSTYKVGINIMNDGITDNYTGINTPLNLNFMGLDTGIKLVYEKLYANNVR